MKIKDQNYTYWQCAPKCSDIKKSDLANFALLYVTVMLFFWLFMFRSFDPTFFREMCVHCPWALQAECSPRA